MCVYAGVYDITKQMKYIYIIFVIEYTLCSVKHNVFVIKNGKNHNKVIIYELKNSSQFLKTNSSQI